MTNIKVPVRAEVTTENQAIFDQLEKQLGFVPNLYATYALSKNALSSYLTFSGAKSSLSNKEKEVVNLSVSQYNDCSYCLAAHTAIGKMNGFTDEEIIQIRKGEITFDPKMKALEVLAKDITKNRGKTTPEGLEQFLNAGYSEENLIDVIVLVGEKTISNYIHNTTKVPVDFPAAPSLN